MTNWKKRKIDYCPESKLIEGMRVYTIQAPVFIAAP